MILFHPVAVLLVVVSSWGIAQANLQPIIPNPGCHCTRKYHKLKITAAIRKGLEGGPAHSEYPRPFLNNEGFKFPYNSACDVRGAPLFEYPLVRKKTYKGGFPSFERVVYLKVSRGDVGAQYCGCISHPSHEVTFTLCRDLGDNSKGEKETEAGEETKAGSSSSRKGSSSSRKGSSSSRKGSSSSSSRSRQ